MAWRRLQFGRHQLGGRKCSKTTLITTSTSKDHYLDQVVTEPTRITETCENILDLFFTNNSTLINRTEIIPGISDHETVLIESSRRPLKMKIPPREVYSYKKGNFEKNQNQPKNHESRTTEAPRVNS